MGFPGVQSQAEPPAQRRSWDRPVPQNDRFLCNIFHRLHFGSDFLGSTFEVSYDQGYSVLSVLLLFAIPQLAQ